MWKAVPKAVSMVVRTVASWVFSLVATRAVCLAAQMVEPKELRWAGRTAALSAARMELLWVAPRAIKLVAQTVGSWVVQKAGDWADHLADPKVV